MSKHIFKRHNKNLILYHVVCPVKYRRKVFEEKVENTLKETCIAISKRYEIYFLEIGVDENHVHFLIQSVPTMQPSHIVQIVKSITAKEIFQHHPEVKKMLCNGHIWTSGYYISTVGSHGKEQVIQKYVKNQRKQYRQIHCGQLLLFDDLP